MEKDGEEEEVRALDGRSRRRKLEPQQEKSGRRGEKDRI